MSAANSRATPKWLWLIGVMTGIGPVSIDLYLPAFPAIEAAFNERGVERTMAAYLVGLALGQLLYGPISDRVSRKPPLYFGFTVYTIGAVGCALAQNMWMLMLFRVVQAIGSCSGIAIGRAIVRDRCEPEQAARAFSTLMMIVSVAPILAPVAGGFIVAAVGWRAAFLFQAALGVSILIAMHFMLTESLNPNHIQPLRLGRVLRTYYSLLRNRAFFGYTLVGGFGMASLFSYVSGAPTILTRTYGIGPRTFGMLIGINGIAFMTSSRLNLRALRTRTSLQILARFVWIPVLIGSALIIAAFLEVPLPAVVALQFVFFLTTARIMPNVSAAALAHHAKIAGSASALLGALQSIVSMFAGVAIATFNNGTLLPLAILMTTSVTIGALLHVWAAHLRA